MGQATTEVTITNLCDLFEVRAGDRLPEDVRKVVVRDAIVDTGVTSMMLPQKLIAQLGLVKRYEMFANTAEGHQMVNIYDPVRVEIMDRYATVEPIETLEGNTVTIGHVLLTMMDWVVDVQSRKLIGSSAYVW